MCITITVAPTVPLDAFGRIVALTELLQETDTNFEGVPMAVLRGPVTGVLDTEDKMRETLLHLLVEDAIMDVQASVPSLWRAPQSGPPPSTFHPHE